jgi:hypothetical protein
MANPDLERIRDRINALREILSGRPPEVTGEVGPLTEEGQRQLDAINKNRLEKSLGPPHTVEEYIASKDLKSSSERGKFIVQEGKPTTQRTRMVFPEFNLRETQVLVNEVTARIIEKTGAFGDDVLVALHDLVAEHLYSDITIDEDTGNVERLGGAPLAALLPGRVGIIFQREMLAASAEAYVDPRYLLNGNKLGLMIDTAEANEILSPGQAATLKVLTPDQIKAAFNLSAVEGVSAMSLPWFDLTGDELTDALAWLDNTAGIIENNTARIVAEGIAAIENDTKPKRFDTEYLSYVASQSEMGLLDPERELYAPGFDPAVEQQKARDEKYLEAYGLETKTLKDRVNDLIDALGGEKDSNLIRNDPNRKLATADVNKEIHAETQRIVNREEALARSENRDPDNFAIFQQVADYVEGVFEPPADGGDNQYDTEIAARAANLEALDLSDPEIHEKAVRQAYFNKTGLSAKDLHPDVLKGLYARLAGSNREEMRDYIEQNQRDIRLRSRLAGMQTDEDLKALIKGIDGMPTLDQLDSPEAKTAFKNWLENTVDAIQDAGPAPFDPISELDPFDKEAERVGPLGLLEAKVVALQNALDQLNPVLTQAGEVVAAAAVQKAFDEQEKARLAEEATYWTSARGKEGFREVMFQQGFPENSITPERRRELEGIFSGELGKNALGSPEETRAIIKGFQDEKRTEDTFIAAGFAPGVARAAATDRIAEGFDINPLGEIVPKPLYRTEHQVIPGMDPLRGRGRTYTEFEPVPSRTNEQLLEDKRIQLASGFPQRPTVDAKGRPIPTTPGKFDPVAETERGKRSMAAEQAAAARATASQAAIDEQTATADWERAVAHAGGAESQVAPQATFLAKHKAGRLQRAAERQTAATPPAPIGVDPFPDETERRRRSRLRGRGRTVVRF